MEAAAAERDGRGPEMEAVPSARLPYQLRGMHCGVGRRQGQSWGGEGTGEIIETQPWWPWSCAGFEGISLLPKPGGGGAVLGAPCAFHRAPCVGLLVALWL